MPELDHFSSLTFEEICQQYFWQARLSGKLPFVPTRIGRWWNEREEVDLVIIGEKDAILVECKWSSKPVGIDILADLERKTEFIKSELDVSSIHFAVCSRSGFTPQLVDDVNERLDVRLLNLAEITG